LTKCDLYDILLHIADLVTGRFLVQKKYVKKFKAIWGFKKASGGFFYTHENTTAFKPGCSEGL